MAEPAPIIRSLDAHYYTDASIFENELRGVLSQTWQFAGHCKDIPNAGDYFTFEIAKQNLFCIRGQDGEIRTFYNVCQHRAHPLLQGSGSRKLIVCPYHSWSYDLTGALRSGPNISSIPNFEASSICLTQVRTEQMHGFVFANLDDHTKPLDDWYPGVRKEMAERVSNINELEPIKWIEVPEACNWKVAIENYSECYHCEANHKSLTANLYEDKSYDVQQGRDGYVLRHMVTFKDTAKTGYPVSGQTEVGRSILSACYLWPLFSFQIYPGRVLNTYHWRVVDADHIVMVRGWYKGGGHDTDELCKIMQLDLDTTVTEDISLIESVQQGLHSRGYHPGPLVLDPACGTKSEHSVQILQRWMRESIENQEIL